VAKVLGQVETQGLEISIFIKADLLWSEQNIQKRTIFNT
jgi:hypothetical protein